MADYSPLNLVPRGLDGTGAAYVLDQNTATAPLRIAERMAYRQQLRAAAEAARQQKQAADLAAQRARLFKLDGGNPAAWYVPIKQARASELIARSAAAQTPQEMAAVEADWMRLKGESDASQTTNENFYKQAEGAVRSGYLNDKALAKAYERVFTDRAGAPITAKTPTDAIDWTEINNRVNSLNLLNDADNIQSAKVDENIKARLTETKRELITGSTRPGGRRTSVTVAAPSFATDAYGDVVTDLQTQNPIIDWNSAKTGAYFETTPGATVQVDQILAEMLKTNPAATRGDALRERFSHLVPTSVTRAETNNPYGPQGDATVKANAVTASPVSTAVAIEGQAPGLPVFDSLQVPGLPSRGSVATTMAAPTSFPLVGQTVLRKNGAPVKLQSVDLSAPGVFLRGDRGQLTAAPKATGFSTTTDFVPAVRGWVVADKNGKPLDTPDANDTPEQQQANALKLLASNPGSTLIQGYWGRYVDKGKVKQGAADGGAGSELIGWQKPAAFGESATIIDATGRDAFLAANPNVVLKPVYREGFSAAEREAFVPAAGRYENQFRSQAADPTFLTKPSAAEAALLAEAQRLGRRVRTPTGWQEPAKMAASAVTPPRRPTFGAKPPAAPTRQRTAAPVADKSGGMF